MVMILPQYKETCKLLPDLPKIGGENMKYFVKIPLGNIDGHSRKLIAELPGDGVNLLKNCNHIVPTKLFLEKVGMIGFFNKSDLKEGSLWWIILKYSIMHKFCQFQ